MLDSAIRDELISQVDSLPLEMQRQVLDFAHALSISMPRGVPGRSLLRFAGALSARDAAEMQDAITTGCEQVDANEW